LLENSEITSFESNAKNKFNTVTHTSTLTPIYNRYRRSQLSDSETDGSFDFENDGNDELVHNRLDRGPYFDVRVSKNVTALVGFTTYLNCRVRNLGNKTVNEIFYR
jgi:hypothetical protein